MSAEPHDRPSPPAPLRTPDAPAERLIAGCMTGTSIDSLDAALVRIRGRGLGMKAELVRTLTRPLGELAPALRRLADQRPMTAGQIAALSRQFSELHLDALRALLDGTCADLIALHGQTVYHAPPVSWQLLTPSVIAHGLDTPVVFDLRAADLAAGGQGAPITPLADCVLFHSPAEARAVVNLGGFCNLTLLPASEPHMRVQGLDVCACNHVLDGISRDLLGLPFDRDGVNALKGSPAAEPLADLQRILGAQALGARSLGTGDEVGHWIGRWKGSTAAADLCATACLAMASAIARCTGGSDRLVLAGGGVKNLALVAAIRRATAASVSFTDEFGIPAPYREAVAMAVLGALCDDRIPITLPAVTHLPRKAPLAGQWVVP